MSKKKKTVYDTSLVDSINSVTNTFADTTGIFPTVDIDSYIHEVSNPSLMSKPLDLSNWGDAFATWNKNRNDVNKDSYLGKYILAEEEFDTLVRAQLYLQDKNTILQALLSNDYNSEELDQLYRKLSENKDAYDAAFNNILQLPTERSNRYTQSITGVGAALPPRQTIDFNSYTDALKSDILSKAIDSRKESMDNYLEKAKEYKDNVDYWNAKISDYYMQKSLMPGMDLTDVDTYIYKLPGLMGSSSGTMGATALGLIGGLMSANPVTAPIGLGLVVGSNLYSRDYESTAEVYQAYKEKVKNSLDDKTYKSVIDNARNQLIGVEGITEAQLNDDDFVLDQLLTNKVSADNTKFQDTQWKSLDGTKSIYADNMTLSAWDMAKDLITVVPLGKLFKPIQKLQQYTNKLSGKLSERVDDVLAYGLEGLDKLPKVRARRRIADLAGRMVLTSVLEGAEEGTQYMLSKDYKEGMFDDEANVFNRWLNNVGRGSRSIFAALTPWDPIYSSDEEFLENYKGGALLGGIMTGVMGSASTIPGVVRDNKQATFNNAMKDLYIDKIDKQDLMRKNLFYAQSAANNKWGNVEQAFDDLSDAGIEGITSQDIEEERKRANIVRNLYSSKNIQALATAAGIDTKSEDYLTYVSLLEHHKRMSDTANKSLKESQAKIASILNSKEVDDYVNSLDIVKNGSVSPTTVKAAIEAKATLDVFNKLDEDFKADEDAADRLQELTGIKSLKANILSIKDIFNSDIKAAKKDYDSNEAIIELKTIKGFDESMLSVPTVHLDLADAIELQIANELATSKEEQELAIITSTDKVAVKGKIDKYNGVADKDNEFIQRMNDYTSGKTEEKLEEEAEEIFIPPISEPAPVATPTVEPEKSETVAEPDEIKSIREKAMNAGSPVLPLYELKLKDLYAIKYPDGNPKDHRGYEPYKSSAYMQDDTELDNLYTDLYQAMLQFEEANRIGDSKDIENAQNNLDSIPKEVDEFITDYEDRSAAIMAKLAELAKSREKAELERSQNIEEDIKSKEDAAKKEEASKVVPEEDGKDEQDEQSGNLYDILGNALGQSYTEALISLQELAIPQAELQQSINTTNEEPLTYDKNVDSISHKLTYHLTKPVETEPGFYERQPIPYDNASDLANNDEFAEVTGEPDFYQEIIKNGVEVRVVKDFKNPTTGNVEDSIYFVFNYKGKKYGAYVSSMDSLYDRANKSFTKLPYEQQQLIRNNLKALREKILRLNQAAEANPNLKLVPTSIKMSNGKLVGEFNEDKSPKNRRLTESVFLEIKDPYQIDYTNTKVAITTGPIGGKYARSGEQVVARRGANSMGSAQLVTTIKRQDGTTGNIRVQLNPKTFKNSKATAEYIVDLLLMDGNVTSREGDKLPLRAKNVLDLIVNFGPHTGVDPNDSRLSADQIERKQLKQFYLIDENHYQIGPNVYSKLELVDKRDEVVKYIQDNFHWNLEEDNLTKNWFGGSNQSKVKVPGFEAMSIWFKDSGKDKITLIPGGLEFTKEDFGIDNPNPNGISSLGWMIKNGILLTNTSDRLLDVNLYVDDVTLVDKSTIDTKVETAEKLDEQTPDNGQVFDFPGTDGGRHIFTMDDIYKILNGENKPKPDGPNMTVEQIDGDRVEVDEATSWLSNKLGIPIEIVPNVIDVTESGLQVVGRTHEDSITISAQAPEGVQYHEAWHRVSQLLISPSKRNSIFKRYTKLGMDEKQVDEMLAEDFREFMLYADSKKDTLWKYNFDTKNWFRRIFDFVRLWARTGQYGLAKVMYYTAIGKYKGAKPNMENVKRFRELYPSGVDMVVNGNRLQTITTEKQLDDITKSLLYAFFATDFLNKTLDYSSLAKLQPNFDNLKRILRNTQATDESRVNPVMDEIIEKFDEVFAPRLKTKLKQLGIRVFDEQNKDKADIEEGSDGINIGQHTVEGMHISIKDNAPAEVKFFMQTIPVLEYNKEGKMVNRLHPHTGFAQFYNANEVWNKVLKDLAGCRTIANMMDRIGRLSEEDLFYKSLLNLMATLIQQSADTDPKHRRTRIKAEAMLSKIETVITSDVNNYMTVLVDEDANGMRRVRLLDNGVQTKAMKYPKIWSSALFTSSDIFHYSGNTVVANQNAKRRLTSLSNKMGLLIDTFVLKNGILTGNGRTINFHDPKNLSILKQDLVQTLNQIGIGIDLETLNKLLSLGSYGPASADEYTKVSNFITSKANYGGLFSIKETIDAINKAITNDGKVNTILLRDKQVNPDHILDDNGFVKVLANTYAYVHATDKGLSTIGAGGNTYYKVSLNNFFKDRVNELNNDSKTRKNLNSVVYNLHSIILLALNEGNLLEVETFINFRDDTSKEQGRDYFGITDREDYISKMSMIFQDRIISPTIADKKTYHMISGIKLPHEPVNYTLDNTGKLVFALYGDVALDILLGYVYDEYERVKLTIKLLDPNAPEYLQPNERIKNYHTVNKGWKDEKGKYHAVEGNGTRFISFNGIYTTKGFISFNDPTKSSLENLRTAEENFFSLPKQHQKALLSGVINARVKQEIETAKKLGIIKGNDNNDVWSLRNDLLDDNVLADRTSRYRSLDAANAEGYAIWDMFADYTIGSIISINEIEKIFSGDPAYYKVVYNKYGMTDNSVDKIKRLGALTSTGTNNRLDFFNADVPTEYTVAELKDHEVKSKQYDVYKELFIRGNIKETIQELEGENAWNGVKDLPIDKIKEIYPKAVEIATQAALSDVAGYKKGINVADAAVYISPIMYKNLMRMLGNWSPEIERAFNILTDEATADKWESDPKLYAQANKVILNSLKYMAFGTRYRDGLGIPYFNKMALFPLFKSVATGDLKPLYDRMMGEQKLDMVMFNSAVKAGSEDAQSYYEGTMDRDIELKDGSMIVAAEMMDKPEQRVRDLNTLHVYKQSFEYLRQQLLTDPHIHEDAMAGTQFLKVNLSNLRSDDLYGVEGDQVTGREIKETIMDCINKLSDIGKLRLEERLLDDNGEVDVSKLALMLLDDAMESDANDNIISALTEAVRTGTFDSMPLSALSDNKWLESRFISLLNKEIIDINMPGGAFIQRSAFGVEATSQRVITPSMINDGRYLRSINDEGSMDAVVSINLFKHIIPNYNKMTFIEARQWLLDHNIIGLNAKANSIGYRIPTQSIASINPLRFVDVFPEIMGDVIMLPEDFTKLTGSDFDIDKLYVARYGYDENGNIISDDSEAGIKNEMLKNYLRVLLTKDNTSSLKLSIDVATDNVKEVLHDIEGEGNESLVQPFEVYTPSYQEARKSEYTGGKAGIGPFALNNAHHILTLLTGLKMAANEFTLGLDIIDMSRIFDKPTVDQPKGGRILDWLSAMINAFVDIAKDPYIVRLNVNAWTYNMVSFLLRAGEGKQTFYFMSLPILKEMAEEVLKTKGKLGIDRTKTASLLEKEAINRVLKKYDPSGKITKKYKSLFKDRATAATIAEELFNTTMIENEKTGKLEETSKLRQLIKEPEAFKDFNDIQVSIYYTWLALKPYADSLANLVKYSKIDTKKTGKTFAAQQTYLKGMEALKEDTNFGEGEVARFYEETFINRKTYNSIPFGTSLFSRLLLRNTNKFLSQKDAILRLLGRETIANEQLLSSVINAMEALTKAKFFNQYIKDNNISFKDMFIGSSSIANRLNNFKLRVQRGEFPDLYINGKYQNDFLNYLLPDMNVEFGLNFISLSELLTNDLTLDNNLINYWRELIEHPNERVSKLFKDLAIYAFFTTGDNQTINGFFKYLPNDFRKSIGYTDFIANELEEYGEPMLFDNTINREEIFLNNWQNDALVKPVNMYESVNDAQYGLQTLNFTSDDVVPNMIAGVRPGLNGVAIRPVNYVKLQDGSFEPVFAPYIKVYIGGYGIDNWHVYKLIGFYLKASNNKKSPDFVPVYGLVEKKGYKHRGHNIYEYDRPTSFDFNKETVYNYDEILRNQTDLYEAITDSFTKEDWNILSTSGIFNITQMEQYKQDSEVAFDMIYEDDPEDNDYVEPVELTEAQEQDTVSDTANSVQGENISSKGSEFAKRLTNPGNNETVIYKGKTFRNAEHAYQTWKSGEFDESAYNSTEFKPVGTKPVNKSTSFQTMVEIITAKLLQHPDLVDGINQRGGMDYILNSWHSVTGDQYWEKDGNFIKALAQAYQNVSYNQIDINNTDKTDNDSINFNNDQQSETILSSDKTILTNEELRSLRPYTGTENPRIAVASEHTDPVFFSKKIIDILDGKIAVLDKFKPVSYTGKDFAALYIITKHDGIPLKNLIEYKIPKIIHFSITGLGGTKWEPGVMKYNDLLDRIEDFIKLGLDPNMVTIRIDPIIPGVTLTSDVENIVKRASEIGIKNIRFSILDQYSTTKHFMEELGYDYSKYYDGNSLHARKDVIEKIQRIMLSFKNKYGVKLSTCAEVFNVDGISNEACLSVSAVNNMLGTNIPETETGKLRKLCSCYGGKTDLLRYDNKCASSCMYCYAHHNANANAIYYNLDGTLKDNALTRTRQNSQQMIQNGTNMLQEYIHHSGGANGSDTIWGQIGKEFGINKSNHYYHGEKSQYNAPNGNVEISPEDYEEGRYKVAEAAKRNWGYQYTTMKDDRLVRNWALVKYADAVFAIGTIVQPGERIFPDLKNDTRTAVNPSVTGGTGYAIGMAINEGKPVHVFDQTKNQWYTWNGTEFVVEDTPVLTKDFAGIGTRNINDNGVQAIRNVYKKTIEMNNKPTSIPVETNNEGIRIMKLYDDGIKYLRNEVFPDMKLSEEEQLEYENNFSTQLREDNVTTEEELEGAINKFICNL